MKSTILRTLAYTIGQPIIEVGKGIEVAGKGMRYVSDKTVVGGQVTQGYGHHVKDSVLEKANTAKLEAIEKATALESVKHSETLDALQTRAKDIEESREDLLAQVNASIAESIASIQAGIEKEQLRHEKATQKNASIDVTSEVVPDMVPATS